MTRESPVVDARLREALEREQALREKLQIQYDELQAANAVLAQAQGDLNHANEQLRRRMNSCARRTRRYSSSKRSRNVL